MSANSLSEGSSLFDCLLDDTSTPGDNPLSSEVPSRNAVAIAMEWLQENERPDSSTNTGTNQSDDTGFKTVFAAFMECANSKPKRPLPGIPRRFSGLANHLYGKDFEQDCIGELKNLVDGRTWRLVKRSQAKTKPFPLKWVFIYKYSKDGATSSAVIPAGGGDGRWSPCGLGEFGKGSDLAPRKPGTRRSAWAMAKRRARR